MLALQSRDTLRADQPIVAVAALSVCTALAGARDRSDDCLTRQGFATALISPLKGSDDESWSRGWRNYARAA